MNTITINLRTGLQKFGHNTPFELYNNLDLMGFETKEEVTPTNQAKIAARLLREVEAEYKEFGYSVKVNCGEDLQNSVNVTHDRGDDVTDATVTHCKNLMRTNWNWYYNQK
jgi:hypothetical protein